MKKVLVYILTMITFIIGSFGLTYFLNKEGMTIYHVIALMVSMVLIAPFYDFWSKTYENLLTKKK